MTNKKILITGAAGFIGFHLARRLIIEGFLVLGFDNFNSYYDVELKKSRLKILEEISTNSQNFLGIIKGDLEDFGLLSKTFNDFRPDIVIHLAAQAGVRYSIENPSAYINSNILGFNNILECCRHYPVINLIYASSSSVYGGNTNIPFSEENAVNHPVSLYAATKKSNELTAHAYSHLFNIPSTGLRFFTVYGPLGRPDMAPMIFAKSIFERKPIKIFNKGDMARDFTYIDDVIESIYRLINKPAESDKNFDTSRPNPSTSWAKHKILNIGNSSPIKLMYFIECLENNIGLKAKKDFQPMQPGDVKETFANTNNIEKITGFKPSTSIEVGIKKFIQWYKIFYKDLN